MDYQKELKELEEYENKNWFKAEKGTYHIQILGEGEFVEKTFGEEHVIQWNLPIMVAGKGFTWSITKGKTQSSVYGQIIKLCANNNNQATGLVFDLIVKSDGKKNDYTIPQALQ